MRTRATWYPRRHPENRGVPESLPDTVAGRDEIIAGIQQAALLNRTATLADVGNVAAFVASDQAHTMTATDVNTPPARSWTRCVDLPSRVHLGLPPDSWAIRCSASDVTQ